MMPSRTRFISHYQKCGRGGTKRPASKSQWNDMSWEREGETKPKLPLKCTRTNRAKDDPMTIELVWRDEMKNKTLDILRFVINMQPMKVRRERRQVEVVI